MYREEAQEFYRVKATRARSSQAGIAYYRIQEILRCASSMEKAEQAIKILSEKSQVPARRAIYRKALREMEL